MNILGQKEILWANRPDNVAHTVQRIDNTWDSVPAAEFCQKYEEKTLKYNVLMNSHSNLAF